MQSAFDFHDPIAVAMNSPIARNSDPEPSHIAARAFTASGRREGQLQAVLALVRQHPLSTSLELAKFSGMDRYIIARRLPELERVNLVWKAGERTCSVGGRIATLWRAL